MVHAIPATPAESTLLKHRDTKNLLRVMTFNVRYDNPEDGKDCWEKRRPYVADLIWREYPDVLALQETLYHQLLQLHRVLPADYQWVGVGRSDGSRGGELNPILWRKSALQLLDWGTFWLSETPDAPGSKFPESCLPRLVTWCKFQPIQADLTADEGTEAPKPFFVFNTHFDHGNEASRRRSAGLLLHRISCIAGLYPCVVTGTFNANEWAESYRFLTSSFLRDARYSAETSHNPEAKSFTGFLTPGALHCKAGVNLDHIFTSGLAIRLFETNTDLRGDNLRCISDHRPLIAGLRLR